MLALQPATAVRDQPTMRLLGLPCRLVDTGKLTCHLRVFDPDGTMTDRSLQPVRMLVRDFGAWQRSACCLLASASVLPSKEEARRSPGPIRACNSHFKQMDIMLDARFP